jgi:hypothetical protein
VPDGICKIDETAARGISVRQLLVVYEFVKRRCVAEGWTSSHLQPDGTYKYDGDGELLTPETVTLYDLKNYVIMPATEACRHECKFVENGEETRARMLRTDLREKEEITCTLCAAKLKKTTEQAVAYWQCHRQCDGRHQLCGSCACCSYVELVTGAGEESAHRCPDGHVPMARTEVYKLRSTEHAEEVSCTQCAQKLELGATYWVCHRCGDRHKLCGECAPAPAPVKCAMLQDPLWYAAHRYGRRCSLPQLAEPRTHSPRTHSPRSKQVGRTRLQIDRVPPPARTRPVLHRRRRRLVARYQVLGVRVRD